MKFRFLLFTLPLLFACEQINSENPLGNSAAIKPDDPHSFSNWREVRTTHLHLDLDVNFNNKIIYGVARHQLNEHEADSVVFDIKQLEIKKITLGKNKENESEFVIGKFDSLLGQSLTVYITPETEYVNIYYQTTAETEALDWLPAELTTGKKHPFLYTQGQAILTRTWIPLQDTPQNRITYSADVQVPKALMAVMSASNSGKKSPDGIYHFEMNQRIPAYLIALAVGDLEYVSLGNKCGVYAEPELTAACAKEFEDIPLMMKTAEKMYGAYQWDQYDIVLLPYSFPFGGMENPRLTFANPTILAGDKSLVSVIAHELAHSWSGNLVTNATWNDFWLNEGFTVYFENRIMETVYSKEIADILAVLEFQDLEIALLDIEESEHPEDSQLKLELNHRNPDEGMTDIAYIKGALFLRTLEKLAGRSTFDKFLSKYFDEFAFQTVSTEEFISYLETNLLRPNKIDFNTNEWIYQPGLPSNAVKIESMRLNKMKDLAKKMNEGEEIFKGSGKNMALDQHITQEWQVFIRELSDDLSPEKMRVIDAQLHFSSAANSAIKADWFLKSVKTGYRDNSNEMSDYLIKTGRRWFIESIYEALMNSKDPKDHLFANIVFDKAKSGYHFVSRSTIETIVKKPS